MSFSASHYSEFPDTHDARLSEVESIGGRRRMHVVHTPIDATSWDVVLERVERWALQRRSSYICLCNVHSVVTASRDAGLRYALERADLALPDGAPVALSLRIAGAGNQRRINGPDLMLRWLAISERTGESVFFYGSTPETLAALQEQLLSRFPKLLIAGSISPPFRTLSAEEDERDVQAINESGASVVFVGLGCPKQEVWMSRHRGRIHAVMMGVGAAFDYHAGIVKRAPGWMRRSGLEWMHRLVSEPRRLLWRYLSTNSMFMIWLSTHVARSRLRRLGQRGNG